VIWGTEEDVLALFLALSLKPFWHEMIESRGKVTQVQAISGNPFRGIAVYSRTFAWYRTGMIKFSSSPVLDHKALNRSVSAEALGASQHSGSTCRPQCLPIEVIPI